MLEFLIRLLKVRCVYVQIPTKARATMTVNTVSLPVPSFRAVQAISGFLEIYAQKTIRVIQILNVSSAPSE